MTRKQMMAMATDAGKRAAQRGMPVRKNPFMEKTLFWFCWKDGHASIAKGELNGQESAV